MAGKVFIKSLLLLKPFTIVAFVENPRVVVLDLFVFIYDREKVGILKEYSIGYNANILYGVHDNSNCL